MQHLKIRRIGNSLGVILPKEVLAELGLAEGDEFLLTRSPDGGVILNAPDDEFERQMDVAEDIMDRYQNALAELAR